MNNEMIFRALFILSAIVMMAIRTYYQSKVVRDKRRINFREGSISLIAGSIAALTSIVFGIEYIFFPGFFRFAYVLDYPDWLRWLGFLLLVGGMTILGVSHHHLSRSFHSLVVLKEDHTLIQAGPYRWIRHPIYLAYLLNYAGGGLLASNLVLTIIPVVTYILLVLLRMGQEEEMLSKQFGQHYEEYKQRTGRLLPKLRI
ncbi:MAG: isoprenylcysteine carboxylmethyltransferase family protein [Anaerolineae bacterium]|nr:isoprenylcysteine carboxylmethyltransferase family protein [Anaerolineae bacterium]